MHVLRFPLTLRIAVESQNHRHTRLVPGQILRVTTSGRLGWALFVSAWRESSGLSLHQCASTQAALVPLPSLLLPSARNRSLAMVSH